MSPTSAASRITAPPTASSARSTTSATGAGRLSRGSWWWRRDIAALSESTPGGCWRRRSCSAFWAGLGSLQLLGEQLLDQRGIRLPFRRLHHLAHEEAERGGLSGAVLGQRAGVR